MGSLNPARVVFLVGAFAAAGCQYLSDRANLRGFKSDLVRLVDKRAPGLRLDDCRLFDNDSFAPAGTCTTKWDTSKAAELAKALELAPYVAVVSRQRPDARGCKARGAFTAAATEVYISSWTGRADFSYLAMFVDRTGNTLCFEARYAWG